MGERAERILEQGKALASAIEPTGPAVETLTWVLASAYRHWLRGIVSAALAWVVEEIRSASERIDEPRPGE